MMIDEAFVANYGGNVTVARSQAESLFNDAKAGLTNMIGSTGHSLNLELIHFTNDVSPQSWFALPTLNNSWLNKLRGYWDSPAKKCIKKDITIILSGNLLGLNGLYKGNGVVCQPDVDLTNIYLLIGKNGGATTIAHEILHSFGLGHLDGENVTDCSPLCQTSARPLMCNGGSNDFLLSSCDHYCVDKFFDQLKCPCLQVAYPDFPADYTCPDVATIGFSVMSDNQHPNIGCRTNGDIVTITATLINDNTTALRNIRAFIPESDGNLAEFVEDPTLNFNCQQTFSGTNNRTEYRITNPPSSNCDNEVQFNLEPFETKTVRVKIRYKGGIEALGAKKFSVWFYTGTNIDFNKYEFKIYPFSEKVNGNFLGNWDTQNPLLISGTYLMNNTNPITFGNGPSFTEGAPLTLFKPGASLVIESGSVVKMNHASFEGCEQMWQGVTIREGALLEMHSMSSIMDAQAAVNVQQGGVLKASDCLFYNNNIGVRPIPGGNGNHQITLMGNKFGTTTAGLKPAYSGQSPAPFANRGFVGIDLVRNNNPMPMAFVLQKSAAGLDNHFFDLHNGILARNTDLVVSNSYFDNITYMPGAPLIFNNTSSGKAISVSGNSLTVIGEGDGATDPVNFSNCHTGIHSFNSTLSVKHNKMRSMQYGILSAVESNKTVEITQNDVQASQTGIGAYHLSTLPNGCNVTWNKVEMNGSATGIGIHTGLFGTTLQDGGNISNNDVTVATGQAGIYAGLSRNLKIFQNDVTLANASTKQGIGLNGGDRISVNCNHIEGQGENGIYSLMAGRSSFACNSTLNTGYGMKFEGTAEGKAPNFVAGNTMADNADAGLLLGADALIGPQEHRGNLWVNGGGATVAQHLGGAGLALSSLFTVDANENAAFLPNFVLPSDWFDNVPIPTSSYQCVPYNTCPFPIAPSDPIRDLHIAGGGITGLAHQEPQLWITKRRLYEKLTEEGNPNPNNPVVSNFLAQAQTNGIKAYGDLQIGLRQLYQLITADIAELQNYETQIAQNLELLAQKEAELNTYGLSQQDSITFSGQRATILLTLNNLMNQQSAKLAILATSRATIGLALTTQNNALVGTAAHLVNEKTVNGILLNLAISGSAALSAAQMAMLTSIANQCPLSGGEGVLAARGVLSLAQGNTGIYNDDNLCNSLPKPGSTASSFHLFDGGKVVVFPNPATDQINIRYDLYSQENAKFQLLDVYGRVVSETELQGVTGELFLPVHHLETGIYFTCLNGVSIGRVAINH